MTTATTLRLDTTQLRLGDTVLTYGMRVHLDTEPIVDDRMTPETGPVYAWVGTVTNATELLDSNETDALLKSFLREARAEGWDRWNVQGNRLAHWTVER